MFSKAATRLACAMALLVSPWLTGASHSQTLTLRTALQRALAASPRLTAAERDVGIATGQRIQAGALINPELSYEQDNSFGSGIYRGTKSAETTLQISQALRAVRQARGAHRRGAGRHRDRGDPAQGDPAGGPVGDRDRLPQRARRCSGGSRSSTSRSPRSTRLTPLLQRRVEAGASSPAETGRAEVASALVKADRERLRATLASARRELAVLMGDTAREIRRPSPDGSTPRDGRRRSRPSSPPSMPIRNWCAGPRSTRSATPSCCWRG